MYSFSEFQSAMLPDARKRTKYPECIMISVIFACMRILQSYFLTDEIDEINEISLCDKQMKLQKIDAD